MTGANSAAVTALQGVLAAEQAASYGYGVVGAHLPQGSPSQAAATTYWVAHVRAVDQLTALVSAHGGTPVPAAVAYELPFPVSTPGAAAKLAATLEDRVCRAYLALVALPQQSLRSFGAQQLRACALRSESWTGTTQAFPGLPASSLRG